MVAFNRVEVETFFFWVKVEVETWYFGLLCWEGEFGGRKNGMTYKLYQ